jgi:hypothetical protein
MRLANENAALKKALYFARGQNRKTKENAYNVMTNMVQMYPGWSEIEFFCPYIGLLEHEVCHIVALLVRHQTLVVVVVVIIIIIIS